MNGRKSNEMKDSLKSKNRKNLKNYNENKNYFWLKKWKIKILKINGEFNIV
jgi:hypothetical protein